MVNVSLLFGPLRYRRFPCHVVLRARLSQDVIGPESEGSNFIGGPPSSSMYSIGKHDASLVVSLCGDETESRTLRPECHPFSNVIELR